MQNWKGTRKTRKVYIILVPKGARGMGHISIAIEQEEGSFFEYSQGAENPEDSAFRLIICKNEVYISKKKYLRSYPISRMLGKKKRFLLPTQYPEKIEKAIDEYILENKPYSSLKNNCLDFVIYVVNRTGEFRFRGMIFPILTFHFMKNRVDRQTEGK